MEAGQPESDRGPKAREISMRTEGGVESSYTLSPFHAARRGEKPPAGRGPQGRPEGGHGEGERGSHEDMRPETAAKRSEVKVPFAAAAARSSGMACWMVGQPPAWTCARTRP